MTTPTAPPTTAPTQTIQQGPALTVTGPVRDRFDEILTPEAIAFLTELHHRFANRRHDRMADRLRRRFEIGSGHDPQFVRTPTGASPAPAPGSRTAAWRSPVPPTRR